MSGAPPPPESLRLPRDFANRHCGLSPADEAAMLQALGLQRLQDMANALPAELRGEPPNAGEALSEREALAALYGYAKDNRPATSLIGLGYYGADMPAIIRRKLFEDPAWYTAYTPYQPEISQGRLEMLLNFQTMVCDFTGLPLAGASLLDEATAAAEAMCLFFREEKGERRVFLADSNLFPQTLAVLQTRAEPLGIVVERGDAAAFGGRQDAFGALLAYPGANGAVADLTPVVSALRANNTPTAVATDLLALALLKTPAEMGADVAVGSAQRFGLPMGAGGPHPGFMAFVEKYKMRAPGRIVGVSYDKRGRAGYRLALQSREQHIRREKATSNICTAQALPAMLAAAYAIYQGPRRIAQTAARAQRFAEILADGLRQMGHAPAAPAFFGTVWVAAKNAQEVAERAQALGINVFCGDGVVGASADEVTQGKHIIAVWRAFAQANNNEAAMPDFEQTAKTAASALPAELQRQTPFLTHPVFNRHHTEQEMLRYLRRLAEKDIALNRSMIPLGSCTMKLNAAVEMEPLSWPQFANVHPFAPPAQIAGYTRLLADFSERLARLTGFDAVSLQPNAGAQGEYAGLLAIRSYLRAQGEGRRDVCLIPRSAHGTNPASAAMAGMRVVSVEVDSSGQANMDDLRAKAELHKDSLAALMLTYPSTCGVFAPGLREICDIIHAAGGQVYLDGANLNALVGLCMPGKLGADVMHINLHKTFCIPHGGGGPGMGPIAAGAHLAAHLPGHPLAQNNPPKHCGTVAAAENGSPLIVIISWLYVRMMGVDGLRRATLTALLAANYIVRRLEKHYPLFFRGEDGFVAHECIVDTREFKKSAGVQVEDIAKRLMDFGYHAPTVSWPVAGALMIEPTESESKAEIDRFCDALLAIAAEIKKIEAGEMPRDNNPLVNAPHTAAELTADEWERPYSRALAAYPLPWTREDKYWPPIGRIDAAYGDRNLVCSCPPMEAYDAPAAKPQK